MSRVLVLAIDKHTFSYVSLKNSESNEKQKQTNVYHDSRYQSQNERYYNNACSNESFFIKHIFELPHRSNQKASTRYGQSNGFHDKIVQFKYSLLSLVPSIYLV